MTKSAKHKKQQKKDFQKLKLKIGKKLKQAQNETKTDFKARKIILKEQLSVKAQSSLITKKQLNIKDLISRLGHHSVYVRQDGVNGLKELVAGNSKTDIAPYLSTLFQSLTPCILDADHLIRSSSVKLLETIIVKMGTLIQPYFTLLTTHLSCAMVNLNIGVQRDSLLLMDVFLSHTPSLIAQKSNTLLNNYLSLIARKMDKGPSGTLPKNTHISHTLLSNPSSGLVTQKWRIKLLSNFCKYIAAILGEKVKLEASIPLSIWEVIEIGSMPPLMKEGSGRAAVQKIEILTGEQKSRSFISNVIPLLLQIWAEAKSSRLEVSEGNPLELGAIQMLTAVAQIIIHLWSITEIVTRHSPTQCLWFMELLKDNLQTEILYGFPYSSLEKSVAPGHGGKKGAETEAATDCQKLNVVLATLSFLYLENDHTLNCLINDFYCELLSDCSGPRNFKLEEVVHTAAFLLEDKKCIPVKKRERLLSASLKCFQNVSSRSKICLLKMPLVASSQACQQLWRSNKSVSLTAWLNCLVAEALTSPNPEPILDVLLQFRLRNTPGFADIMSKNRQQFKEALGSSDGVRRNFEVVV